MKKGKNRAAAAVELAAVLLATAAAFAWGQRAALIERGYTARGGEYLLLLIPAIYYIGKQEGPKEKGKAEGRPIRKGKEHRGAPPGSQHPGGGRTLGNGYSFKRKGREPGAGPRHN